MLNEPSAGTTAHYVGLASDACAVAAKEGRPLRTPDSDPRPEMQRP